MIAAHAAAIPSGGSSSYGASAPAGLITASPQGLATSAGTSLVFAPNVDIAGLLTTGLTLDTASTVAAYSRVTSVNAQMSGSGHTLRLTASQVASTCNSGTDTASANLISGVLTVDGTATALPSHPTVGQSLTVGVATVTLNNQSTVTSGGVEDQAVHIHFTGTSPAQDLYLAVTVCNNSASSNTITVTNPGPQTSNSGTAITPLQIVATDSDTSQVLTYSATGLPTGLSINTTTGVISGTPTTQTGSPFTVQVTATDSTSASDTVTFTFNVTSPNTVTVTNPGTQTSTVNIPITPLTITVNDTAVVPAGSITCAATGNVPSGLSFNTSTCTFSGTPDTVEGVTVIVTATDSTGASGSATFNWEVVAP